MKNWRGYPIAALLLGNVCLAVGPWFVRVAGSGDGIGPIATAFWRLALAAPLILLMTWRLERDKLADTRAQLPLLLFAGIIFAADLVSWHLGIERTKLANAALLGNTASWLFPAWGFWLLRQRPSLPQASGLLLAGAGAVLLIGRSAELARENLEGDLLCLLAGVLYTFFLVAIGRARTSLPPWSTLLVTTAAGAPVLLALALLFGERVWPRDWLAIISLALVAQVAGQVLLMSALGQVQPVMVGVMLLSQPVVGAAIGWAGYNEQLGVLDLLGACAIAAAIVLVAPKRKPVGDIA